MSLVKHKFTLFIVVFWVLLASPAVFYAAKQHQENQLLISYLETVPTSPDNSPWQNAKLISKKLREDFNVEEVTFTRLNMADRPFLRESSDYLLEIKEGLCGEGTRVLVNLLLLAGYDATRISLYDRYLNSSHTLVSLRYDGNEYLIDSINTPAYTNRFLNNHQINAESFHIVHYSDDVTARMDELAEISASENKADPASPVEERFFERFRYYSYEALPYTKVVSVFNVDARILNFDRPSKFISSLAEKPYQIMSFFWLTLSSTILLLALVFRFLFSAKFKKRNTISLQ